MRYKVGIIGCGAILNRHLESIDSNDDFELISMCDIQENLVNMISKERNVFAYTDYKDMVLNSDINFVTIASPNSLHYEQAIFCLENGCDVLIEKPVAFTSEEINDIIEVSNKYNRNSYCVLQVRLNPTVQFIKDVLNENLLGDIYSVNFIQRWQRPLEYFTGWRSIPSIGGGTLYEVGIHYLDILQYIFGKPNVHSSKIYNMKHKNNEIEDTVYSILDYGNFGGTCEVTISTEPHNLECSISISGSNGFVKIGGKALNIIESGNFLSHGSQIEYDKIKKKYDKYNEPNSYGVYQGSCPNHPELYKNLDKFKLEESLNVISLIDDIYDKSGKKYRRI